MKRFLAILLAAMMLLATASFSALAEGEPTEITIFYTGTADGDRNEMAVKTVFEEKTNTKLTFMDSSDGDTKLVALLASGEDLDVFRTKDYVVGNKLVSEGLVRSVDDLLEYMPNFMSRWDSETLDLFRAADGKLYCFPSMRDVGYGAIFYRNDWLEALGMEEPTTLDEYYDMIYAFRYNDPDGNGEDDTWGLITEGGDSFELFCGPFGLPLGNWFVEDGELYWADTHERMKDALAFGRKIFDDGLAPTEYLSLTGTEAAQLVTNGTAGVWRTVSSANASRMIALREVVPTGTSKVLEVPTAEGVESGVSAMSNIVEMTELGSKSASSAAYITSFVSDEKAIEIAKFIDWFYSDEGANTLTYGVEGLSYNLVDGVPELVEEYQSLDELRSIGAWDAFDGWGYIAQRSAWHYMWDEEACTNMANTSISAMPKQIYWTTPLYEELGSELQAKRKEIFTQVLGGVYSVDEGWELWLSEFDRIGGNDMVEEMRAEYAARNAQ